MGLSALALEGPNRLSDGDVTAGLVLPFAAVKLLGYSGAVATTLMIFMAVTSAFSAQLIAVSSIWTYDIYQAYIDPKAKSKQLVWISHLSCAVYSVVMAGVAVGLSYAGIGMGYLYVLMGVIISSAVFPGAMTLLWKGQNAVAAATSPPLGLAVALVAWLVTAKKQYGILTVDSTGANYPMLAGNVAALCSPIIFVPVLTYIFGSQNYDYVSMQEIRRIEDTDSNQSETSDVEQDHDQFDYTGNDMSAHETQKLNKAAFYSRSLTVVLALAFLILWPIPMYGTSYVFSKKFFTGWVVVGILWLFFTCVGVVIFPLYEGRQSISRVVRMMARDATGRPSTNVERNFSAPTSTSTGAETPPEKLTAKSSEELCTGS